MQINANVVNECECMRHINSHTRKHRITTTTAATTATKTTTNEKRKKKKAIAIDGAAAAICDVQLYYIT